MRDSVPSPRYSPVCNVLRQWKTSLIPTYRVYRLYDTFVDTKSSVTFSIANAHTMATTNTYRLVGYLNTTNERLPVTVPKLTNAAAKTFSYKSLS